MLLGFTISPADSSPIWKQIENGVRRLIASGVLESGGLVPSVRELAQDLQVNPATVARAYQRLRDAGVLSVRRGEGTYVAERSQSALDADRSELLTDAARQYAKVAVTIRASRLEAVEAMALVWDEISEVI